MDAELRSAMSRHYLDLWNDDEQARIDADIDKHRRADAVATVDGAPAGAKVEIRQVRHAFYFGAHIFNYDQLGTDERNRRYKNLYGTLFNSATVAFYWKTFEPEEGAPRFAGDYRDTADFWNTVGNPKNQPHWRRPATDPVIDFLEAKGVRIHGHPLVWGNCTWQYPEWLARKTPAVHHHGRSLKPEDLEDRANYMKGWFDEFTAEQLEKMLPDYAREINFLTAKRILEIALCYRGRVHSWDVVNESAVDFANGRLKPGSALCQSVYGLMPGDYAHRSFKIADGVFPKDVLLNINDYWTGREYVDQTRELLARGCKIDVMGSQMHIFNPQNCLDIADGKSDEQSPAAVRETMARLSAAGPPLHLSEITITSPTTGDKRGEAIQAAIARNLYRLWFSVEKMNGITWWNVVDDCGAPGEPGVSGLFTRDMEPKKSFHALDGLINGEWTTRATAAVGADGKIRFRGFRGDYELSWRDDAGNVRTRDFSLV